MSLSTNKPSSMFKITMTAWLGCPTFGCAQKPAADKPVNQIAVKAAGLTDLESEPKLAVAQDSKRSELHLRKEQVHEKTIEIQALIDSLTDEESPDAQESIDFLTEELAIAQEELSELSQQLTDDAP